MKILSTNKKMKYKLYAKN